MKKVKLEPARQCTVCTKKGSKKVSVSHPVTLCCKCNQWRCYHCQRCANKMWEPNFGCRGCTNVILLAKRNAKIKAEPTSQVVSAENVELEEAEGDEGEAVSDDLKAEPTSQVVSAEHVELEEAEGDEGEAAGDEGEGDAVLEERPKAARAEKVDLQDVALKAGAAMEERPKAAGAEKVDLQVVAPKADAAMEERPKAAGAEKVDLQTPKAHVELVKATTDTPVNELSEEEGDDASPEEEGDATSDADMEATTDADHEATTKAKVVTAEGPSQVPVKWMPYSVVPGGLGGPARRIIQTP